MIGLEKWLRSQERDAGSARARREDAARSSEPSGLPELAGATSCAGCGVSVPRSDAMFSEAGPVCPSCFAEREEASATDGASALALRAATPLPVLVVALACAWFAASAGPMAGKGVIGFLAGTSVVACAALVSSLQALATLRECWRPDLDGARRWGAVASAGVGAALAVSATVVSAATLAWPFFSSAPS